MLAGYEAEPGSKIPTTFESTQIGSKRQDCARRHGPDAGNSAKTAHVFIRLGGFSELQHQSVDLLRQKLNLVEVKPANIADAFWQINRLVSQNTRDRSEIGRSLRQDDPKFAEVPTQRIDELRLLADKALMGAESHGPSLVLRTLHLDIMHIGAQCRLGDCCCVGRIILLAFDERLYTNRRYQPDVVTAALSEATSEVTGGADLHRDDAGRLLVQSCCNRAAATPALPTLLFSRELNVTNAELRTTFRGRLMAFHSLLAREVDAGQKAGLLRGDIAANDAAALLTSLVQGMAIRWALGTRDFDLQREGLRLFDVQRQLLSEEGE